MEVNQMEEKAVKKGYDERIPTMLNIKEAAKRCRLSSYCIRKLCLEHKVVFIKSGNKYLINLESLIQYLNTANG